jgi:hypothetical protein
MGPDGATVLLTTARHLSGRGAVSFVLLLAFGYGTLVWRRRKRPGPGTPTDRFDPNQAESAMGRTPERRPGGEPPAGGRS